VGVSSTSLYLLHCFISLDVILATPALLVGCEKLQNSGSREAEN
jgi:hypothetical protein